MTTPTRDRILDAALGAFATRGVDGTPITDLEAAAGLAPGSGGFYRYFATKDEALVAVVRREVERIEARRPEDLGDDATTADALAAMLDALQEVRPLMALLAREHGRAPELAAEVADRLVAGGLQRDRVWRSVLDLDADPEHVRAQGAVVLSALVGYLLATDYFGSPPAEADRASFVAALADLLDRPPSPPLPDKERSL